MTDRARRNQASLRQYCRNVTDLSLTMGRRVRRRSEDEDEAEGEDGNEVLQRLAGTQPEIEAAHSALGDLLEALDEADQEDLEANVSEGSPGLGVLLPD